VKKDEIVGFDRKIVWLDCEMTGLRVGSTDPERPDDEICEIGVIVTDGNLVPVDNGITLVIKPSDVALAQMNSYVQKMHKDSGLLAEIPNGVTVAEAEKQVMEYITKHVPERQTAQMGGNTIHMDRRFLAKYMPAVEDHVHYRSVDVSALKEMAIRWYPDVFTGGPSKNGNHRALADAIESIRELDYYRTVLLSGVSPSAGAISSATETVTKKWQAYLS
jgi:oligoribonuclease